MLLRQLAHLGLGHTAQGKESPAELLLGKSKEKICLILGAIGRTLEQPTARASIEFDEGIMAGSESVRANLLGNNEQLIKLQVIVAEAARNRRAPGKILLPQTDAPHRARNAPRD